MTTVTIPPGSCIDGFLLAHRSDTEFLLLDGEYTTLGASAFPDWCSLGPKCRLIGRGSDRTSLSLISPVVIGAEKPPIYHEILTAGSRSSISTMVEVIGLTIDARTPRPAVGLHAWSSAAYIADVRVIGVWGDPRPASCWEGFGILVNRSGESGGWYDGGCLVEDCSVEFATTPPEKGLGTRNYATGIYVGIESRPGTPIFESRVELCRVSGSSGAFVPDVGFGINSSTVIRQCEAWGVERGVFSDTGEGRDSLIERCRFVCGYAGVDLKSSNLAWQRVNTRIRDCDITLRGSATSDHVAGLVLDDQSKDHDRALFHSVTARDCRFINASAGKAYRGSINARRSAANGTLNCEWLGDWTDAVIAEGVPADGWISK